MCYLIVKLKRVLVFNFVFRLNRLSILSIYIWPRACVNSLSRPPRWSPLTSLPPRPLIHGGNTSGSPVEETQTGSLWWLQLELCGHSSESHKQVTSTVRMELFGWEWSERFSTERLLDVFVLLPCVCLLGIKCLLRMAVIAVSHLGKKEYTWSVLCSSWHWCRFFFF